MKLKRWFKYYIHFTKICINEQTWFVRWYYSISYRRYHTKSLYVTTKLGYFPENGDYAVFQMVGIQTKWLLPWKIKSPKVVSALTISQYANLAFIAKCVFLYLYLKVCSLCPDFKLLWCSSIMGSQETIFHQHDTKSNRDSGDTMCVARAVPGPQNIHPTPQ